MVQKSMLLWFNFWKRLTKDSILIPFLIYFTFSFWVAALFSCRARLHTCLVLTTLEQVQDDLAKNLWANLPFLQCINKQLFAPKILKGKPANIEWLVEKWFEKHFLQHDKLSTSLFCTTDEFWEDLLPKTSEIVMLIIFLADGS